MEEEKKQGSDGEFHDWSKTQETPTMTCTLNNGLCLLIERDRHSDDRSKEGGHLCHIGPERIQCYTKKSKDSAIQDHNGVL